MKRVVTIQDISCIGRCSLTVALPIISAMGVETAILPTAVLSTHTAFEGFTFRDLTQDISQISAHWKSQNIEFDGIYTGYLGSFEQLTLMSEFVDEFRKENTVVVVDPVMADNGKLYPGFTKEFAAAMAKLCAKADVIMPNLTEACFMLDIPYPGNDYTEADIREILSALGKLGSKKVILTGASFGDGRTGAYSYDSQEGSYYYYARQQVDASYHGTGDVFASSFTGAVVNGKTFEESIRCAVDYTVECIKRTEADPEKRWYGVNFEEAIPYLISRLHEKYEKER